LAVNPMTSDIRQFDAVSDSVAQRLSARASAVSALPAGPQQQLAEFQQRFTGEKQIAASLGRLHAVAKRHGVVLDQGEFRFANNAEEALLRYAIVLPVKADYRAIRRFIREALLELPGLAVEEVNLRRNDPKTTAVEAQLRFVLFVTKGD
jgi:hypothetical protein